MSSGFPSSSHRTYARISASDAGTWIVCSTSFGGRNALLLLSWRVVVEGSRSVVRKDDDDDGVSSNDFDDDFAIKRLLLLVGAASLALLLLLPPVKVVVVVVVPMAIKKAALVVIVATRARVCIRILCGEHHAVKETVKKKNFEF